MDPVMFVKIATTMLLLDSIWIYLVAGNAFSSMIHDIQGSVMKIRHRGVVVAYAAMILLFNTFITRESSGWNAFLLGFLTYALFDGTNYALFDAWNPRTAIIDSVWGGLLFWLTSRLVFA